MSVNVPIPFAGCFVADASAHTPWTFLGICDDTQSSYLRGPADAPEIIRRAYDGRCFNSTTESGVDLSRSVADRGDLKPRSTWEASAREYREAIEHLLKEGEIPFIAGGDHAVTVPVVGAFEVLRRPIHVIQFDAHPDLYPEFEGNPDSHACTAARLLEMDHVATVTQLGVRTMNEEQMRQCERYGDRLFVHEAKSLSGALPELGHIEEGDAVYVTVDMDGFDPAHAPGVSHPVPGGLDSRQVLDFLQRGHWTLVGMDAVEVNPTRDFQYQTAILAARLLHEGMGYAARGGQ